MGPWNGDHDRHQRERCQCAGGTRPIRVSRPSPAGPGRFVYRHRGRRSDQNNNPLSDMVSFDQTGALRWMVPGNYQPQIATADGGLIATDPSGAAYTFDQYGGATGVLAGNPTQSWTGSTYQLGSIEDVANAPTAVATPPYRVSRGPISRAMGRRRYATMSEISSLPNTAKPPFWTVDPKKPWPSFVNAASWPRFHPELF